MAKKGFNNQSVDPATADRLGEDLLAEVAKSAPDTQRMKDLIAQGANLEKTDKNGMTPLLLAAMNEKNDAAFLLLDSGADPDGATPKGMSPLILTSVSGSKGNLPLAKKLLDKNADPEKYVYQSQTALMWASHRGFKDIAVEIAGRGGDILRKSEPGNPADPKRNAIEWAEYNLKQATVEALERVQKRKELAAEEEKKKAEVRKAEAEAVAAKQAFEDALQHNISTHKPLSAPKRASFRKKPEMPGQK